MSRSLFFALLLAFVLPFPIAGQDAANALKREFRGAWIATVMGIDFPRKTTTDRIALREQYRMLLTHLQRTGFNAVVVQIRSVGDAYYPSQYAPWSAYLTGRQGLPPEDDFDVLAFMVEETHRRGMEFHAWMNPYRLSMNLDTLGLDPKHVFHKHREWVVRYGNRLYLQPGLPEVWSHIAEVVGEVVTRYDVDAIHFDDYFYPYTIAGETFPDSTLFRQQAFPGADLRHWRRHNVDAMIRICADRIRSIKPWVRFGISPFGVWRNRDEDPRGSDTRAGITSYDDLYADVLKWLENGWIDYVMPQLYWHVGFPVADHGKLLSWWSANTSGKPLIVGHAAYKVGKDREDSWHHPEEIKKQIQLSRSQAVSRGSCFYNTSSVLLNRLGVRDTIRQLYAAPALLPEVETQLAMSVPAPPDMRKPKTKGQSLHLRWKVPKRERDRRPAYYALYRFEDGETVDLDRADALHWISPFHQEEDKWEWIDHHTQAGKTYTYVLTSLNRLHQESRPTEKVVVRRTEKGFDQIK